MPNHAVGIDLGTTFSVIAHVNAQGVPEILPNAEGERITPSVVLFEPEGVSVGSYAQAAATAYPEKVVEFVKRTMGNRHSGFVWNGAQLTPEAISSHILSKLKRDAEAYLGHPVEEAVVTVPAYFNDIQRRATLTAGKMAGLRVLKLINEPTAAAFAYGLNNVGKELRVLVFDLGGGTFDVTLADIGKSGVDVIATEGDHKLGGKDWDDALLGMVGTAFQSKFNVDPLSDPLSESQLRERCVSAKISLTRRPEVTISHHFADQSVTLDITREMFEQATDPLINRTEQIVRQVITEAKRELDSVDIILLAGGSTRMPMVHKMLERVFGRPPATDINPDEAIALGAALSAAIESAELRGEQPIVSMRTRDVTSHSLGMVVYRDDKLHNSTVIHKNTPIPTEMTREDYSTSRDDQTTMDVWLVQGEDPDPLGCVELGHFEFYGIPPRKAGVSPLKVTFRYNQNGMVEVEAMDTESRRVLPHRLSPGNITLQDVVNDRTPVQIAVLMDCSGSVYGPHHAQAKQVATRFITQSLALPHRQLALISFPGGVCVPPTTDVARLSSAMDDLVPIGVSPLGQALTTTRRLLRPKAGAKQLLVVFSDGTVDDPSLVSHEIKHLRTAGTRIITVGIGSHIDADFLSKLSTSGTNYHPCHDKLELDSSFLNLATQEASV